MMIELKIGDIYIDDDDGSVLIIYGIDGNYAYTFSTRWDTYYHPLSDDELEELRKIEGEEATELLRKSVDDVDWDAEELEWLSIDNPEYSPKQLQQLRESALQEYRELKSMIDEKILGCV